MFGSKNMAFLQYSPDVPHHFQHTFLCFPYIFVIFQFLDNDYGILPTAEDDPPFCANTSIHYHVHHQPIIHDPSQVLAVHSVVKCTLPPSRAGMACCKDSKANVNGANDACPKSHISTVNLHFMPGCRTHDIPSSVLANSHYHDTTSIALD